MFLAGFINMLFYLMYKRHQKNRSRSTSTCRTRRTGIYQSTERDPSALDVGHEGKGPLSTRQNSSRGCKNKIGLKRIFFKKILIKNIDEYTWDPKPLHTPIS